MSDTVQLVHSAAAKEILYLPHALRQMAHPERRIRRREIEAVVWNGAVIEDYPDDARGHSCLLAGLGDDARPVHVVCAPKAEYLAIITAYLPAPDRWGVGFRRRK